MCTVAACKIAQKQQRVSEADYRRHLWQAFGVASSRELSATQRDWLRAWLISQGGVPARSAERKVWALWYELRSLLPPARRSARYLYGICAHVIRGKAQITSLSQLSDVEIHKVIEALKMMLEQIDPAPF